MSQKVKRKRIDWFAVLNSLDRQEYNSYFFNLLKKLRRGKYMSVNRCAYCTLKHFYSTTTITELAKKVGVL